MSKWYFYILFSFLCSCTLSDDDPKPTSSGNIKLVSSKFLGISPVSKLKEGAQESGFGDFVDLIKYSVAVYKIEYTTPLKGKQIKASGIVAIPYNLAKQFPILIANHGTITKKSLAPTESPQDYELILMASAGYITLIPDFIGFGSSEKYLHPYYISSYIHTCIVDMLVASKEFLLKQPYKANDKVFMFGYSEGGYVALGAHRAIEKTENLNITATAAGAGGYDLELVMEQIIDQDTYDSPSYLAYIIYSYHTYYDWEPPLDSFFTKKYANEIPSLFDGQLGLGEINSELDNRLDSLFNKNFLISLRNKSEGYLLPALRENSIKDWVPSNPIQFYHGTSDEIVPFIDSKTTYESILNNGGNNVEFYPLENKTHSTGLESMIYSAIPWYRSLNVNF